jgi:hypothetical protein
VTGCQQLVMSGKDSGGSVSRAAGFLLNFYKFLLNVTDDVTGR